MSCEVISPPLARMPAASSRMDTFLVETERVEPVDEKTVDSPSNRLILDDCGTTKVSIQLDIEDLGER
jgi:hypothetical protein